MGRACAGFLLLFATTVTCAHGQTLPKYNNERLSLATDWDKRVHVSPDGPDGACVDQDKNLHLITGDGFWVTLDRNGKVIQQTFEPELQAGFSNISVWCTQQGQIVIGITSQKAVLRYTRAHQLLSREVLPNSGRGIR